MGHWTLWQHIVLLFGNLFVIDGQPGTVEYPKCVPNWIQTNSKTSHLYFLLLEHENIDGSKTVDHVTKKGIIN